MHKALSQLGYRLQYSVFALDLDERERQKLAAKLRRMISETEDDVRFYLVPPMPRGAWHGPQTGGDGLTVSGAPAATLVYRLSRQSAGIQ